MGNSLSKCEEECKEAICRKDVKMLESALQNGTCDVFKIMNPDQDVISLRKDFIMETLFTWRFFSDGEFVPLPLLQQFKSAVEKNRLNKNNKIVPAPQWSQMKFTYLEFVIQRYSDEVESCKDMFLFFLDNDDLFPHNKPGYSLLHQLCETPTTIDLLRELISSGKLDEKFKNSNSVSDHDMKTSAAFAGKTPLQLACEKRNVEAVKELCSNGIGGKNYGDCVKGMLKKETFVSKQLEERKEAEMIEISLCLFSQPGSDAIRKHVCRTDPSVMQYLEKYFDTFQHFSVSLSFIAGERQYHKLRDVLIQNGCKARPDKKFFSLRLFEACGSGDEEFVKEMLVRKRAVDELCPDIDAFPQNQLPGISDEDRHLNCLLIAASRNYSNLCALLLDAGANVDARDKKDGYTPLMLASRGDNGRFASVMMTLLQNNANVNAQNNKGQTALHVLNQYTKAGTDARLGLLLESEGVDVNLVDNEGKTPLMVSVEYGRYAGCQNLLEAKARTDIVDKNNKTVKDYANASPDSNFRNSDWASELFK